MGQRYKTYFNPPNIFSKKRGRGDLRTTEGSPVRERHKKTHSLKWVVFYFDNLFCNSIFKDLSSFSFFLISF